MTGRRTARIAVLRASSLLLATLILLPSPLGVTQALAASPPTDVQAQGLSDRTVELIWSAVPNADSYSVIRNGTQIATTVRTLFDDGGLSATTSYIYQISAIENGIASTPSSPVSATTQAPLDAIAPSSVGTITAKSKTSTSVSLSWGAATDNQRIEGYRILRGPGGASPSSLIDISTTDAVTSYTDNYLRSGATYTYGVQAIDTEDNAGPLRTVSVTTSGSSDSTPPSAPSGVTTRTFSSSRIDITWGSSSSSDASGYQVLRNGIVVGQVDRPLRFYFSDNGLAANTTYSYTIKTIDSAGNFSAASAAKSGTTLAGGGKIIARGPYVQSVTATSARVVWWTNIPTTSRVDFGAGALTNSVADAASVLEHVMLLSQLSAGTTYTYIVGDGSLSSPTASFKTSAPAGSTFTFAAIGDFGGNSPGETQNGNIIAADSSQFIQTLGDNIYPEAADPNFATTYSDFDGRLFKQFGAALKLKAFWGANGNKEYYGHGAWAQHMFLPNNERWYSYDWGSAHILVLDSEMPFTPGTPQYAFAQADLAAHQSTPWRIVALQRPPYSSSSNSSSSIPVRTYLVPLFEQQHVQLVMSGNSHNYERTYPLVGGAPATGGVTYIVSGNGGNGFNSLWDPLESTCRHASLSIL